MIALPCVEGCGRSVEFDECHECHGDGCSDCGGTGAHDVDADDVICGPCAWNDRMAATADWYSI